MRSLLRDFRRGSGRGGPQGRSAPQRLRVGAGRCGFGGNGVYPTSAGTVVPYNWRKNLPARNRSAERLFLPDRQVALEPPDHLVLHLRQVLVAGVLVKHAAKV